MHLMHLISKFPELISILHVFNEEIQPGRLLSLAVFNSRKKCRNEADWAYQLRNIHDLVTGSQLQASPGDDVLASCMEVR